MNYNSWEQSPIRIIIKTQEKIRFVLRYLACGVRPNRVRLAGPNKQRNLLMKHSEACSLTTNFENNFLL